MFAPSEWLKDTKIKTKDQRLRSKSKRFRTKISSLEFELVSFRLKQSWKINRYKNLIIFWTIFSLLINKYLQLNIWKILIFLQNFLCIFIFFYLKSSNFLLSKTVFYTNFQNFITLFKWFFYMTLHIYLRWVWFL